MELEIEEIVILGDNSIGSEKRFRIKVKGTNITLNIRAETEEEAMEKAVKIMESLQK